MYLSPLSHLKNEKAGKRLEVSDAYSDDTNTFFIGELNSVDKMKHLNY